MTIASASEHMISLRRDARLHQVDDVGLGEHAALGGHVVQLASSKCSCDDLLARHADLDACTCRWWRRCPTRTCRSSTRCAVLSPVSSFSLKMMILASWPPSSITLPTSGCRFSTASVTALTSCTNFAPSVRRERRRAGAGDERADPVLGERPGTPRRSRAAARAPSRAAWSGGAGSRSRGSPSCAGSTTAFTVVEPTSMPITIWSGVLMSFSLAQRLRRTQD